MKISRELALLILKYLLENKDFNFPFKIMCKRYENNQIFCKDNNYTEIIAEDDYDNLLADSTYNDFELWEDLQNLDKETLELMVKGFIEKITYKNAMDKISILAKKYRKSWKIELCKSVNIEEYGLNEYLGGKADAYEECLKILQQLNDVN